MPRKPFARGAAQADRHRHLRRGSAILYRAHKHAQRPTYARTVQDTLRGHV